MLQRNTRSAGQTSMPNRPQCTAQVNKTHFIFTIHLIVFSIWSYLEFQKNEGSINGDFTVDFTSKDEL